MKRRRLLEAPLLTLLILLSSVAAPAGIEAADEASKVVLRGRVVCLDESGRPRDECREGDRFALMADGKLYRFIADDPSAAMFADPRVRGRLLQITALLRARDLLEVVKVHSVKQGRLYDIYYFCEVCNITAYAPGPCTCCREEMELKETPASDK